MKSLSVLRLERIYINRDGYYCHSSFLNWLSNVESKIDHLVLISPVLSGDDNWGGTVWKPKKSTKLLRLPDSKGYFKALFYSPIVLLQVFRARLRSSTMLMRVPEHGNMLNAIICKACFLNSLYVWLVADRNLLLKSEIENRKPNLKLAVGYLINRITGFIEKFICSKSNGLVNGVHLLSDNKIAFKEHIIIESTTFSKSEINIFPRSGISQNEYFKILYVGRLSPEKSVDVLINAAHKLSEITSLKIEVRLCGDSHMNYGGYLKTIAINSENLKFSFLGHVPFGKVLFDEYNNADVLCLPSSTEGTARVLLEACAFGLPIIVSDIPANKSLVMSSSKPNPGIVFIPQDINSLTQALINLYTNDVLYQSCSEAGIIKASSQTIDNQQSQIIEFIFGNKSL